LQSACFSDLVKAAGLNPAADFRFADLSFIDFSESDLRGYDFTGANLSGTLWSGARWDSTTIVRDAIFTASTDLPSSAEYVAKQQEELRQSEARLQLALEADDAGMWEYAVETGEFVASDRALTLHGLPPGSPVTHDHLLATIHQEDQPTIERAWRETLETGAPLTVEIRCPQPDGSVRWLHWQGKLHEIRGQRRLIGLIRDISQRMADQLLLIRELNYRTKNLLSVVQSIANQTVASSPTEFLERFTRRVQALSLSQDLIVRSKWRAVEIEDLVRTQLAHFADLIGERITIEGPPLNVKPSAAQSIGMALHELATNADKYGSLSNDHGSVTIDWRIDDDQFSIGWIEQDGPRVTPPKRRGFGSTVISAVAQASVGGEVELHYAPSGVTWRLTCPVTKVLASQEDSEIRDREN
jgi:PAS domain S-box-containing protein